MRVCVCADAALGGLVWWRGVWGFDWNLLAQAHEGGGGVSLGGTDEGITSGQRDMHIKGGRPVQILTPNLGAKTVGGLEQGVVGGVGVGGGATGGLLGVWGVGELQEGRGGGGSHGGMNWGGGGGQAPPNSWVCGHHPLPSRGSP